MDWMMVAIILIFVGAFVYQGANCWKRKSKPAATLWFVGALCGLVSLSFNGPGWLGLLALGLGFVAMILEET